MGGRCHSAAAHYRLTEAEVARIPGMPTAGNENADTGAGAKPVRDGVEFQPHAVGRLGQPPVAVADIARAPPRVDLADPDEHVDVRIVRGVCQLDGRGAVDAEI